MTLQQQIEDSRSACHESSAEVKRIEQALKIAQQVDATRHQTLEDLLTLQALEKRQEALAELNLGKMTAEEHNAYPQGRLTEI